MNKEIRNALTAIMVGLFTVISLLCILGFAEEKAQGDRVLGIMYHQVLKDTSRSGKYIITPDMLEQDLATLKEEGYISMLPREIARCCDDGMPLPEKCVVISFDDGYETGLSYVLPLLKKYDMKAVINIVGSYTDQYTALPQEQKSLSYDYLTWEEVKELSDSGIVEIGCHTYNLHENGERLGCAKKLYETDEEYSAVLSSDISLFQEKMQSELGFRAVSFAYPFGAVSDGSMRLLREMGFDVFMTCAELPTTVTCAPVIINRYNRDCNRPVTEIISQYNRTEGL